MADNSVIENSLNLSYSFPVTLNYYGSQPLIKILKLGDVEASFTIPSEADALWLFQ